MDSFNGRFCFYHSGIAIFGVMNYGFMILFNNFIRSKRMFEFQSILQKMLIRINIRRKRTYSYS